MTDSDDTSTTRVEQVMEVYDDPGERAERRFAGLSPRTFGLAAAVAVSHAAALVAGRYALAVALLVATLAGVGAIVTDRVRVPYRAKPR